MESAGLEFVVDCPPLPAPVYVDREMWEKIVLNLLSNAFKFTLNGSVTVRLDAEGNDAVLTVCDTGTGIPEAELPRIFERFHRVEGARGRTYEGTGIGLALIQELVKLHNGSISATSVVGEGTTFRVCVPMGSAHLPHSGSEQTRQTAATAGLVPRAFAEEIATWLHHNGKENAHHNGHERARTGSAQTQEQGGKPRVLLADDNADMREHVSHILGDAYEVVTAGDGEEALRLLRQDPPDLLLSDVMMPRLDGLGLLREIRADVTLQTLPVIFLSARAGEDMRVEGLRAGADDYLVKPFTANELNARVGTHIQMALTRRRAIERESSLRAEAEAARDEVFNVLESITDGFIALDDEWRITYVNGEAEKLNGLTRDEMVGKNHWDLFPATIGTRIYDELNRAARERVAVEFENYYQPWDRWFHVKAYPQTGGGISLFYEDITAPKRAEEERAALLLRAEEARKEAETLNEVARNLAGELDLQKLVQSATDAATRVTGAQFGAFFYNVLNDKGESYILYTLSGAPREAFEHFGLPRNTAIFDPTFRGTRIVRSADILKDPSYGHNPPHHGMPRGHLPVRSYLAVPVVSRSGEVFRRHVLRASADGRFYRTCGATGGGNREPGGSCTRQRAPV